jgi:hypothetical protein
VSNQQPLQPGGQPLGERNLLLRRGLVDDFRSATEMALQLAARLSRNIDPRPCRHPPSPGSSTVNSSSGTTFRWRHNLASGGDTGSPPSASSEPEGNETLSRQTHPHSRPGRRSWLGRVFPLPVSSQYAECEEGAAVKIFAG